MSTLLKEVDVKEIRSFIEINHYSKSINGCKISKCFGAYKDGNLVGAALYGELSTTAWKKYADKEKDVLELRRLVTINKDKNFLSKFLAWQIKQLKKTSYKLIVSYADPYHNHIGYIYQATNWSYLGTTAKDNLLLTPDGRTYHSRAMRTKYKGVLKPFAQKLQELYDQGLLKEVQVPGKHIYVYSLVGKQVSNPSNYPKEKND